MVYGVWVVSTSVFLYQFALFYIGPIVIIGDSLLNEKPGDKAIVCFSKSIVEIILFTDI